MKCIDLRSDTVTVPTKEMKKAFLMAEYGDLNRNEDPVVIELEREVTQILGKQAACFVPSGTFGNQCAIFTHSQPGDQIIMPECSHLLQYENGGMGAISKIIVKQIECSREKDGLLSVELLQKNIRKVRHRGGPRKQMFTIENPTSNGRVYSVQHFNALAKCAKQNGLIVHLDGARLFNATTFLNVDPKDLVEHADTVSICLSKALCMPVGSVVAGSKKFIEDFRDNQYMMGGCFQKIGMFAAMGLVSLREVRFDLKKDHEMGTLLGKKMQELGWIKIVETIDIHMILFKFKDKRVDPVKLTKFLLKNGIKVFFDNRNETVKRVLVHRYIRQQQIQTFISMLKEYYISLDEHQ